MFSQDTASIEQPPGVERTDARVQGRGRAGAVSPAQLGRVYIGERDLGEGSVLALAARFARIAWPDASSGAAGRPRSLAMSSRHTTIGRGPGSS